MLMMMMMVVVVVMMAVPVRSYFKQARYLKNKR
jgi:hypothetical protein